MWNLHLILYVPIQMTHTNFIIKLKTSRVRVFYYFPHKNYTIYNYYLVYGCIIIITFVAIHIWAVSRLNCIQRARKWVNAFFLQFFFPPQSIVRMTGDSSVASAYRVILSGRFFFYIR